MPIHIAICDDTEEDITLLSDALYSYDPSFEIISYTDGLKLLEDFQDIKNDIDILFLDIYMPGLNGIETAESIRKVRKDLKIIFITSSKEHYPEAYEVFAFNYILKPMDKKRLYNILEQVLDDLKKDSNQKISFTYKSKVYSVEHRHILFIESRDKLILFP